MKTYKVLVATLSIGAIGFLSSCGNASSDLKDSDTLEEFEAYVNELSSETDANWEEIERKYIEKKNAVGDKLEDLTEEEKTEFEKLQANYEELKAKVKDDESLKSKVQDSELLEEFKAYVNEISAESEASWEEIERKYIQKKNNVSDDLDNLSDEAKEEFQELQDKYEEMKKNAKEKM